MATTSKSLPSVYRPVPAVPGLEPAYPFSANTIAEVEAVATTPVDKVKKAYQSHFTGPVISEGTQPVYTNKRLKNKVDNKSVNNGLNTGSPDVTKTANILSGINTGVNAALGIYGAIQASKQKPVLASYQAPIEPDLIDDNTEAIKTAGEEKIDKAVNTSREQARRLGISDNTSIGKETEALNQLSGQLAQYKSAIDAQNVGMKNQFKQYNDQAERQRGQFNAQTQNQFNIYQSQLMGQALSGVATNITSGMDAITHNLNYRQVKAEAQKESEIDRYWSIYANKDIGADDKAIAIRELRKRGVTI